MQKIAEKPGDRTGDGDAAAGCNRIGEQESDKHHRDQTRNLPGDGFDDQSGCCVHLCSPVGWPYLSPLLPQKTRSGHYALLLHNIHIVDFYLRS